MATRGRKPKPTAMKELEGNPGKHPLNTSEPKPNKKAPACPKWLEPEAKKEWRRLAKQMEAIGILTEVDAQPNRKLYDVLTKGSGEAREQPLFFLITTAGTDKESICYELHMKAIIPTSTCSAWKCSRIWHG